MKQNAIIIAYNSLNNSGVPNVIYQTILSLRNYYDFDIVTFEQNNFYLDILKKNDINISIHLLKDKKKNSLIGKIWWHSFGKYLYWSKSIKKIFIDKKYDVIHSFKEFDSFPFLKEAKKANVSTRILHTNVDHAFKKPKWYDIFYPYRRKKSIHLSTIRLAPSFQSGTHAFKSKSFITIHNSFNENKYFFSSSNQTDINIVQVGTFSSNKNQVFSINTFNEIVKKYKNSKLTLIGYENEVGYADKIIKKVNELNLKNNVELINGRNLDYVSYSKYSFAILPSCHEGASLVAVEAQACGLDVFASNTVPVDINCGGVHFISLEKGPVYWANEIIAFIKNNEFRHKYNIDRFSSQKFKESIKKIYNKGHL